MVTSFTGKRPWGPRVRAGQLAQMNTLSIKAYELIRADVIGGRLTPDAKLMTSLVKQQYGIGGSPMREALTRLAADGLLKNEGQKGFRVAAVSVGELADLASVRLQLELLAVAAAIRIGNVEWEVRILSEFRRLQHVVEGYHTDSAAYADLWETTHRAFHFAILSGCDSPWLLHFFDRIYDQTERYRRLFTRYENIPPPLISSHKEILDALIAGDRDSALALTRSHIAYAARQTLSDMLAYGAVAADPDAEAAIAALSDPAAYPVLV